MVERLRSTMASTHKSRSQHLLATSCSRCPPVHPKTPAWIVRHEDTLGRGQFGISPLLQRSCTSPRSTQQVPLRRPISLCMRQRSEFVDLNLLTLPYCYKLKFGPAAGSAACCSHTGCAGCACGGRCRVERHCSASCVGPCSMSMAASCPPLQKQKKPCRVPLILLNW